MPDYTNEREYVVNKLAELKYDANAPLWVSHFLKACMNAPLVDFENNLLTALRVVMGNYPLKAKTLNEQVPPKS